MKSVVSVSYFFNRLEMSSAAIIIIIIPRP